MRWRRPSAAYVVVSLAVLALIVLFIRSDWRDVSRQLDAPRPTSLPHSSPATLPHDAVPQERLATTRTFVESLGDSLASKISAANGLRCVIVVDEAGRPVRGASVEPVSASINGEPRKTDADGKAWIPLNVSLQPTRWVNVRKPGFKWQQIDVPEDWPLRVIIVPESS